MSYKIKNGKTVRARRTRDDDKSDHVKAAEELIQYGILVDTGERKVQAGRLWPVYKLAPNHRERWREVYGYDPGDEPPTFN